MKKGEIRAVKIGESAIREWLWETLSQYGNELFDISSSEEDDVIFSMSIDDKTGAIIFYSLEFSEPHPVNFGEIASYLNAMLPTEVDSLYKTQEDKSKIYKVFIRDY